MPSSIKPLEWKQTHYPESEDYVACEMAEASTSVGYFAIEWKTGQDKRIIYSTPWNKDAIVFEDNVEDVKQRIEEEYYHRVTECLLP